MPDDAEPERYDIVLVEGIQVIDGNVCYVKKFDGVWFYQLPDKNWIRI